MTATVIDLNVLRATRETALRNQDTAERRRLGPRLTAIRQASGLTQRQVSERTTMSQGKISTLEKGKGSLSRSQRAELARVYGLNVEALTENPLEIVLRIMAARRKDDSA